MRAFFFFALFLVVLVPRPSFCQEAEEPEVKIEQAMEEMLDSHPYRFSIFWVMPEINLNSGYDSNGLFAPSGEVIGDYFFSVSPGGSLGLRFGSRAFLVINENVNFVYYQDLDQLRDIYSATSVRFTTGSRRTLWTLDGGYVNRKTGVDSEFDVPVQQKSVTGGADVEVAVATKWDLDFHVHTARYSYDDTVDDSPVLSLPPDYRRHQYGNTIRYKFSPLAAVFVNATVGRIEFLNQGGRQNDTLRVFGGIRLNSPGIKGQIRIGYGQTQTERFLRQDDLRDLIGYADIDFIVREKSTIGAFFRRDHDISRIGAGNFRVTTEAGIRGTFPFGKKMFGDASYRIAKNDYGERVDVEGVTNLNDVVHSVRAGLNYHLLRNLILRGGGVFYTRDSNFRQVEKSRFAYDLGIRYFFNP